MSEPRDCRCTHCHCWIGTRNPDAICEACTRGQCQGEPRFIPEWRRRAEAHELPAKVIQR